MATSPLSAPQLEERDALATLWHQVTSGRFRIVDWYDRDGRRYVVARPAGPAEVPSRFSARQRRAVALRASGASVKVIAAELGISMGTASGEVQRGLGALGLDSAAALTAVLGHVAA